MSLVLSLVAHALLLRPAAAQERVEVQSPALNAQAWRMPIDAEGTLWTNDAGTAPNHHVQARVALSYMKDPIVFRYEDGEEVAILGSVLTSNLLGSYTYEFLRVGVDVPIILYAVGDSTAGTGGLGDLAVELKGSLLDREAGKGPVGVALLARLTAPTATVDAALGAPGVGWELEGIVDGKVGPVLLAGNLGTRGVPATSLDNVEVNDQLYLRAGAAWLLTPDAGLSADLNSNIAYQGGFSNPANSPLEGILGGFGRLDDQLVLRGGVGFGLISSIGAPDLRLVAALGWEPREVRDRDGDGLWDKVDGCPEQAEDIDRYKDDDGCPDPTTKVRVIVQNHVGDTVFEARSSLQTEVGPRDAGGEFELQMHPGEYLLKVDAPRYAPYGGVVVVPEAAEKEVKVQLQPLFGEVRVTVRSTTGAVPAAEIQVDADPAVRVSGGVARALADAGRRAVVVRAEGFKTQTLPISVTAGQLSELEVVLEPALAKVTAEKIEILEKVFFDLGKATIKPESFPLLDEVAGILRDNPDIRKVQVEGHTDNRGKAATNRRLSQARADSVKAYLVSKGVDEARLSAAGFGPDRPLDPANNDQAWDLNRRVEFVILERDAPPAP